MRKSRTPKPIKYRLIVDCIRPGIGEVAQFTASTPFPAYPRGTCLEMLNCSPKNWDIGDSIQRLIVEKDGSVVCATLLLANSDALDEPGFVAKNQVGKRLGPSDTNFF